MYRIITNSVYMNLYELYNELSILHPSTRNKRNP